MTTDFGRYNGEKEGLGSYIRRIRELTDLRSFEHLSLDIMIISLEYLSLSLSSNIIGRGIGQMI